MPKRDPAAASAARVFLVFLLLSPVSPQCWKGTAGECQNAEFVPGTEMAGLTFDITNLKQKRSVLEKYYWKQPDGGCTLCTNPLLEGNPTQKLPLVITDWKVNKTCQQEVQHSVHQSAISVAEALTEQQVKNDWTQELDVKISPSAKTQWTLAGSESEMTKASMWKGSWEKYISLLHHITCSYYKLHISNNQLLSADFEYRVKNLPETYDRSSMAEYLYLIGLFGTHFVKELGMGAHIGYLTGVPVCMTVLEDITISELSRCLAVDLGIAFGFDGVTNSPDFQMCQEKKKNPNFFLLLRVVSVSREGGIPWKTGKEWLETTKSIPAPLFYSLEPLHTLLDKSNPRRDSLRQAVSEYVLARALQRNCTFPCPPGTQLSATDFCSCECPNNDITNTMCCSKRRGLAKLTVTIEHAEGLWGDYITHSDGYVRVFFQKREMCTKTVWNNDNPAWNVSLDFGDIQFHRDFSMIRVEVWDEDFGWNDDLLGRCWLTIYPWKYEAQICYLDHGRLHFKYRLVCGNNLGGPSCRDYSMWFINNSHYSGS